MVGVDTENPGKVYEYGRALIRFGAGKTVGHLWGVDSYKERHVKKMGVSLNKYLLWDGNSHPPHTHTAHSLSTSHIPVALGEELWRHRICLQGFARARMPCLNGSPLMGLVGL